VRLQNALAAYLRQWWPHAESAGSGRPGSDVLGTPGVVWECKTPQQWRVWEWTRQAQRHVKNGEVPVCVYWPHSVGERRPELALAILPLPELVKLLRAADFEEA
jgi:hypothetical protein